MVIARDLKIALRLKNEMFRKQMARATMVTLDFKEQIKESNEELKKFQQTVSQPGSISFDEDVEVDLVINKDNLKKSIENWIKGDLGRGQNITRLPLKVSEGELKRSINMYLERVRKGRGDINKLSLKVDTTKDSLLMKSLDRFIKDFKKKVDVELSGNVVQGRKSEEETKMIEQIVKLLESINRTLSGTSTMNKLLEGLKAHFDDPTELVIKLAEGIVEAIYTGG